MSRERIIIPTKFKKMTPKELALHDFFYTRSLYDKGVLEKRLAAGESHQSKTLNDDTEIDEESSDGEDEENRVSSNVSTKLPNTQQCAQCSRRYLDPTSYSEHVAQCRVLDPKRCPECLLPFMTSAQRDRHQREAHGTTTKWTCPYCTSDKEQYISEKSRDIHVYKMHKKNLSLTEQEAVLAKYQCVCSQCGFISFSKKTLQVHRTKEHISKEWTLWCPACAFGVDNTTELENHVQKRHSNNSNWYVCTVCLRVISRLGGDQAVELHRTLHREGAGYTCEQCGKMFEGEEKLAAHSTVHSNPENSFHCGICDIPNRSYRVLARHMISHQMGEKSTTQETSDRPSVAFVCNECAQPFELESQLVAHQICIHQGCEEYSYPCPFCGKVFAKQRYLSLHLRLHLDEKPYVCTVCQKSFSHSASLKSHTILKHTRGFRFHCPQCDKGFISRVKTVSHLTHVHHVPLSEAEQALPRDGSSASFESTENVNESTTVNANEDTEQIDESTSKDESYQDVESTLDSTNGVFYQLTHPDGTQSVVRLEPGQQLVLEDERGVKQVIDFDDVQTEQGDKTPPKK